MTRATAERQCPASCFLTYPTTPEIEPRAIDGAQAALQLTCDRRKLLLLLQRSPSPLRPLYDSVLLDLRPSVAVVSCSCPALCPPFRPPLAPQLAWRLEDRPACSHRHSPRTNRLQLALSVGEETSFDRELGLYALALPHLSRLNRRLSSPHDELHIIFSSPINNHYALC